jgi:hypothetical protein
MKGIVALFAVALWCPEVTAQTIYKCKDAEGKTVFSDKQCAPDAATVELAQQTSGLSPADPTGVDQYLQRKAAEKRDFAARSSADYATNGCRERQKQLETQLARVRAVRTTTSSPYVSAQLGTSKLTRIAGLEQQLETVRLDCQRTWDETYQRELSSEATASPAN